jgi:CDP-4-dehydro-6-deoxyglucose reductase
MPDPKFLKPWHGIPREQIDWYPTVDADACIGCGTCVTGCSRLVYRFDFEAKKATVFDPLNCLVGCTTCANTCPAHAISFPSLETVMEFESLPLVHHAVEDELLARRDALELHQSRPSPDRIVDLVVAGMKRFGSRNMVIELAPRTDQDGLCQFVPGQYMELWLPDSDFLSRAYSIGSAPRDDGVIELDLRRVEGGRFSEYVFERMQVGDVLRGRGPLGMFRVTSSLDTPLLFAARGTGFAPIKAMIEQQLVLTPQRDMLLFWGATDASDFYALDEVVTWRRADPNLAVVLAARTIPAGFSTPEGLTVEAGTVYDAIAQTKLPVAGRDAYVAGPRRTTTRVVTALRARGLDQSRIMVDAYGD